MIAIGLCAAFLVLCFHIARRSLVAGLCAVLAVGYVYGILRANLPTQASHLLFDCGVLGL